MFQVLKIENYLKIYVLKCFEKFNHLYIEFCINDLDLLLKIV